MTKYNKITDLQAANKRALLSLRSKTIAHQAHDTSMIVEDTPPQYNNKEAVLLKNQLNDCRDTLLGMRKLSKINDTGTDARKSMALLDNLLTQMIGANMAQQDCTSNVEDSHHNNKAFALKMQTLKMNKSICGSDDYMLGNNNEASWQQLRNYQAESCISLALNVDFSHIKNFEKQKNYNPQKHQLIIETAVAA